MSNTTETANTLPLIESLEDFEKEENREMAEELANGKGDDE